MLGMLIVALLTGGDTIRNFITAQLSPGDAFSSAGIGGHAQPGMLLTILSTVHSASYFIPIYEVFAIYAATITLVISIRAVRWLMRVQALGTGLGG